MMPTGGMSFQGSSSATASGRSELTSGHIFNFGENAGAGMSPWMIGGVVVLAAIFLLKK